MSTNQPHPILRAALHLSLLSFTVAFVALPTVHAAVCTTETGKYWPGGIIPFVFDDNVTPGNRQRMRDAMTVWESVSRLAFIPHSSELNWLHIRDHTFDGAELGRQAIGFQTVNVTSWDRRFRMVHLLGHSLGLMDEDMRYRSEFFIAYQGTQFDAAKRRDHFGVAFELVGTPASAGFGDYDLDSVMHPSQCAFSACNDCPDHPLECRTIVVLPRDDVVWQDRIGTQEHLSEGDKSIIQFAYPPANWTVATSHPFALFENGTLIEPYHTLQRGVDEVPERGTLWLMPGHYDWQGTFSKAMTVRGGPFDERVDLHAFYPFRKVVLGRGP